MSKTKPKKKIFYLLDNKLNWKGFKKLQSQLVDNSGPVPQHGERIVWEMMRNKQILCWFAEDIPRDMGIGFEIPKRYKNWEKVLVKNPINSI